MAGESLAKIATSKPRDQHRTLLFRDGGRIGIHEVMAAPMSKTTRVVNYEDAASCG
jgi:hypothetical protein